MSQLPIKRALIIAAIREFFANAGFVETDTPTLVRSPGMEPHIRPIEISRPGVFLPTSPEFAMKRLLAQGHEKIFQICKAYRNEPLSTTHHPEFTMLEWYRANSEYQQIMTDVEQLFGFISLKLHNGLEFESEILGKQKVFAPWQRISVEECFRRFAGIDLPEHMSTRALAQKCFDRGWAGAEVLDSGALKRPGAWDDLFFRVMMNAVEPALAQLGSPVIVFDYPESQAALSNVYIDSRGLRWAKRFEVYAAGLELGNAFDELTDPVEQRRRFEKDMQLRREVYGEDFAESPVDPDFLESLAKMPPSGGIAMGVDRIVMYFTGAKSIEEVLWLPSYWK